jgi:2-hydroxychromene-2-carboxylate isomerase
MTELLRRRILPSTVIRVSQIDWPARTAAAARRARGGRGRVDLYLAFDDAASAVAALDLADRLHGRAVDLVAHPVVERGIPGDPAVDDKRRYAIADAVRRGRRLGLELTRDVPLDPAEPAFLAGWVAGTPPSADVTAFCVAALELLWFGSDGPVVQAPFAELWRSHVGGEPRAAAPAVRRVEARMARHGPYDTPAAVVGGRWFFAHDRPAQIAARLDDLGWTP